MASAPKAAPVLLTDLSEERQPTPDAIPEAGGKVIPISRVEIDKIFSELGRIRSILTDTGEKVIGVINTDDFGKTEQGQRELQAAIEHIRENAYLRGEAEALFNRLPPAEKDRVCEDRDGLYKAVERVFWQV